MTSGGLPLVLEILHPLGPYELVTQIIPVLQIMQRHHQPRAHPRRLQCSGRTSAPIARRTRPSSSAAPSSLAHGPHPPNPPTRFGTVPAALGGRWLLAPSIFPVFVGGVKLSQENRSPIKNSSKYQSEGYELFRGAYLKRTANQPRTAWPFYRGKPKIIPLEQRLAEPLRLIGCCHPHLQLPVPDLCAFSLGAFRIHPTQAES